MTPTELSDMRLVPRSDDYRCMLLDDGRPVLSVVGGGHAQPFTKEEMAEIARRTIACWNVCDGFPTDEPEPEKLSTEIIQGSHRIGFLEAQVAAMTSCLRTCLGAMLAAEPASPSPALTAAMAEVSDLLRLADQLAAKERPL